MLSALLWGCSNLESLAAEIARKISRAITLFPNSTLYAVGSRTIEKATRFAAENAFPDSAKVYGSYEALLDDPDVDAVYMPLPTSLHVKWAVLAPQKKKHLLLEKPVALNVKEFDVIVDACESNGVQIMDATMWVHNPRTAMMGEFVKNTDCFCETPTRVFDKFIVPALHAAMARIEPMKIDGGVYDGRERGRPGGEWTDTSPRLECQFWLT